MMLNTVLQTPSATINFRGLAYTLEENLLSVAGSALTPIGMLAVDEVLDLAEQEPGPLMLRADGTVSFVQENALAHLGFWDGTNFTYIDHSAG